MTFPARCGLAAALALTASEVRASEPLSFADGRLTLGGELSATLAPDDPGFFNYNDYEHSLRAWRVSVTAQARAGDHLALLAELLSENADSPRAYALYLRVRPWTARSFDVQAGVIPPVFGAFARRRYGPDNPLIGLPLGYQYLTSLRPDALPATAEDLLERRGQGWLVSYPIGNPAPASGLPLVNALRWDTGVQVRIGSEPVELSVALTQGSLSNPRVTDDNDGKQLSARLAWLPVAGLVLGVSGARGEYLTRELDQALPADGASSQFQSTWGVDVEYSVGYGLVRAEIIWCAWDMPDAAAIGALRPLRSTAFMGEGRYKLAPGFYLAARVDHMAFGRLQDPIGSPAWEAPVTRVEGGFGYSPRRNLLLKGSYQHNRREAGPVLSDGLLAAQLVLWF